MKREELEQLLTNAGIADTKELVDKIMAVNGADISKVRGEIDALNAKYAKYDEYKVAAEGKQAEIDKAVEEAKASAKTEYDKQLEAERTSAKRKRAREKAYEGLNDEQKGILDAFVKDEDLKLSDDGESFSNFDEATKGIKEKYKSLFPKDDGTNDRGGLPPAQGQPPKKYEEYEDYKKLR